MPTAIAYLLIVLIWATTPLAMKWSAEGAGFAFAVLARMALGTTLAAGLLAAWRLGLPLHRRARYSYLAGGLGLFGAMSLTYWGAGRIPSGLISVLFGLSPLITGLLAAIWLGERAVTLPRLTGLLCGLAGLGLIFSRGADLGGPGAALGLAALLVAVFIHSASLVAVKRIGDDSPALATTCGTLAVSLPLFGLVWLVADGHAPGPMTLRATLAILYLGVAGSVLGFTLYYYLIRRLETGQVALITLITPVLALFLGRMLNGEQLGAPVWGGALLILGGLGMHQWEALRRVVRERPR